MPPRYRKAFVQFGGAGEPCQGSASWRQLNAGKLFGRPLWSNAEAVLNMSVWGFGRILRFFTHLHDSCLRWIICKQQICAKTKRSYLCFFTICVCFWEFIVCHSRTPRTGSSQKKVMNIQRRTRRSNSKNTRDGRVCRCSLACSPRFSWVIMGHPLSSWWCMQYILVGPWWIRSILM